MEERRCITEDCIFCKGENITVKKIILSVLLIVFWSFLLGRNALTIVYATENVENGWFYNENKDGELYVSDEEGNIVDITGFVDIDSEEYYVDSGRVIMSETIVSYDNTYWYIKDGKRDSSKTGFVTYNGEMCYVENGIWDNTKTGFVTVDNAKWYIKYGKLHKVTTLVNDNGQYLYVKNGKWDNSTTLVNYKGTYWYVENGYMKRANTLVKYGDNYWYVKNGKLCRDTTLVKYGDNYWYVRNGMLCRQTTLVKYQNSYWFVYRGMLKRVSTIAQYNGKYYYIYRGKVNNNYTGVITYKGEKWKVINGIVPKAFYKWPAPGNYEITSPYGKRPVPTPGASSYHQGIDIACDYGDPVVACADGIVYSAAYSPWNGNYVFINHGGGVVSLYLHNSEVKVKRGQKVEAGQLIALAGSTGISTGPHLHFGIKVNDVFNNPQFFIKGGTEKDEK